VKRFLAAFLFLAANTPVVFGQAAGPAAPAPPPPAAPSPPASAPSQPPPETLRDLRLDIAQGKMKDTPALCDRLRGTYEANRAILIASPEQPNNRNQAAVETFMACYCIYAKAQVQALTGDLPGAEASLKDAAAFQAKYSEFNNPRILPIMQDLDVISRGLILEHSDKLDAAVQTYLPITYQTGPEAPIATGRLAVIELKRGHVDKAQSWAYIHADDPTSQFVLAQIAQQKKNLLVAQRHATTAIGLLQKQLKDGKEYMPAFYVEAPAIRALSKKLPPLPPPPPKPAAPKPNPPAPAPVPPKPAASPTATPMM